MVLRGGWGLTYFPTNMHSPSLFRNPPFTSSYVASIQATGAARRTCSCPRLPEPQPTSATNPVGNIAAVDEDFKSMRITSST